MPPTRLASSSAAEVREQLRSYRGHEGEGVYERAEMIDGADGQLFSVLLEPSDEPRRRTGLVLCPSFFELRMLQGAEFQFLRSAARAGFTARYVQPVGMGDSDGAPADCTVSRRVDAAIVAADQLRADGGDLETVAFVGARLGAAVALIAAERSAERPPVMLWDPAIQGDEYWKHSRRFARVVGALGRTSVEDPDERLARGENAVLIGYEVTPTLRADLSQIDRSQAMQDVSSHGLLVALNEPSLRSMQSRLSSAVSQLDGATLGLPSPRNLIRLRISDAIQAGELTVDWMRQQLS